MPILASGTLIDILSLSRVVVDSFNFIKKKVKRHQFNAQTNKQLNILKHEFRIAKSNPR